MTDKKRVLILGSVEDFSSLTIKLNDLGAYTIVVDAAENGDAKKYADKAYNVDLNDEEKINSICKIEQVDQIITSFSDNLFELMVKYSHQNGLPTYCSYEKVGYLRDKIKMKKMFSELHIPYSLAQRITRNDLIESGISIQYPFVLKPLDGWGSRGMYIINNYRELLAHFEESASYSVGEPSAIIEEINDGHEINVQSWVRNGEIHFINFGDRETSGKTRNKLQYLSRQKYPSVYYREIAAIVKRYLLDIANYVGILEGPLSIQLFYKNGVISVGEVAGRFFGMEQKLSVISNDIDRNELLANLVFNPDMNDAILRRFNEYNGRYAFGLFIKGKPGIVRDCGNYLDFITEECVKDVTLYARERTSTTTMPWLIKILGCCDSQEDADKYTEKVYQNLFIPGINGENLVTDNSIINYFQGGE